MNRYYLAVTFICLTFFNSHAFAAKPVRPPAVPPPDVHAVKIDYTNGLVLIEGADLHPASAAAELAGVPLTMDGSSTESLLQFPFTSDVTDAVDEMGNYVVTLSTDGGSLSLTAFIPFGLALVTPPPPPGEDCPCSTEWDDKSTVPSPSGFAGQTPYCSEDTGSYVTVQFYDIPANNYWVLRTQWSDGAGYCELYIDVPRRSLSNQTEFDACASYLRNIVLVWGNQDQLCLF